MSAPRRGFTLLEVIIAMAILGLSLAAIFDLNAGAIAMHRYTKKLTVASMLARSKMTDLEQELYDKGFQLDDDEDGGDFSAEGWPNFKWRARILAPKTSGVSPEQLLSAVFGIPLGGEGESGGIGDMLSGFMGGGASKDKSSSAPTPSAGGLGGMGGMASGLMQGQLTQMLDQITKAVREVHLTVTWKEGTQVESIDLVTHIVSLGQGSDRNGPSAQQAQVNEAAKKAGIDPKTGQPLPQGQQGSMR